jgi:hypothetical protein
MPATSSGTSVATAGTARTATAGGIGGGDAVPAPSREHDRELSAPHTAIRENVSCNKGFFKALSFMVTQFHYVLHGMQVRENKVQGT